MPLRSEPVPETVHYANGKVKLTGFLLDGSFHGAWGWYRTDGTIMRTGEFDRGQQVGVWRTFDRSGRMVKETDFTKRAPVRAATNSLGVRDKHGSLGQPGRPQGTLVEGHESDDPLKTDMSAEGEDGQVYGG